MRAWEDRFGQTDKMKPAEPCFNYIEVNIDKSWHHKKARHLLYVIMIFFLQNAEQHYVKCLLWSIPSMQYKVLVKTQKVLVILWGIL